MRIVQRLVNLKCCNSDRDEDLSAYFKHLTSALGIHNVFNPSFCSLKNVRIFAFRAIPNGGDSLTSFVSIEDEAGQTVKNLSMDLCGDLNTVQLIDPKIARINGGIYITFNSGYVPAGNDVFIMKVYPEMESPRRVLYKGRQEQERNWAFFSENDEIYALYRINPLKILKLQKADQASWEMEDYFCEEGTNEDLPKNLSIGTQLAAQDEKYYFVAHKKLYFMRKKIYFGKLCMLDFKKRNIRAGKFWLIHSLKSLLGSRLKHNTNLLSCTYFSGIQASPGVIRLGYGINDLETGFSVHTSDDL